MEVQRACTMFENNLDRAQTNSVETIGEYNNIVPICSWSAWWTKEEGRGEGVKNRNESIEIERRRRSKVSINERREKARGTRGQRVRGVCVTAAVAGLKATGRQSITVLLPGIRLYQLCNAAWWLRLSTIDGILDFSKKFFRPDKFGRIERIWDDFEDDYESSFFSFWKFILFIIRKNFIRIEISIKFDKYTAKNRGRIFYYKKVYFTVIPFPLGKKLLP